MANIVQLISVGSHWLPAYRRREWLEPGATRALGKLSLIYQVHRVRDRRTDDGHKCELTALTRRGWIYNQIYFDPLVYPVDQELYLPALDRLLIVRALEIGSNRPERVLLEIVDLGAPPMAMPGRNA